MSSNSTDKKQIRKFGLIALIFFGALGALGIWKEKFLPAYLFGFLSVLGLGFITVPVLLRPVYDAWQQFAHFISRVMTNLILVLIYYLVITPSGLIKRLTGGSPIPLKPDKKASSYWVKKPEPAQPRERFVKRY